MKIISMKWSEVPAGAIVLCPDGVQREIGPLVDATGAGEVRRHLGTSSSINPDARQRREGMMVNRNQSEPTIVVVPDPETDSTGVILMFMRAGFAVEVLPG